MNVLSLFENILYLLLGVFMCYYSIEEFKKDWKNRETDYSSRMFVHLAMIIAFFIMFLLSLKNIVVGE